MRPHTIFAAMVATLFLSCKKNDYQPPQITDPFANETFGKRLQLDEPNPSFTWSNNSRNFFVMTSHGTYLYNPANHHKELVLEEDKHAYVVQVSPDEDAIFLGEVNNRNEYYKLDLSSMEITELMRVPDRKSIAVYVGNKNMFIYQGDIVTNGRPCESWDDFFCGVYSTTINLTLKHKRFDNNAEVELRPDVGFNNFSPDGTQAVFSTWDKCFIFNTATQSFEDSLTFAPNLIYANFHWINNTIQYPTFQFGSSDIVVMDLKSNQEVKRFTTSLSITEFTGWPAKSNKIFYTGACNSPGCTYAINELDLTTMTERQIVTTSAPDLQTSPFHVSPSPDGNTIVFNDGYASYIKPVN